MWRLRCLTTETIEGIKSLLKRLAGAQKSTEVVVGAADGVVQGAKIPRAVGGGLHHWFQTTSFTSCKIRKKINKKSKDFDNLRILKILPIGLLEFDPAALNLGSLK
mgnify:CR=1 FL=1